MLPNLHLTGWDKASRHTESQLPSSTGLWPRQWADRLQGSGPKSRLRGSARSRNSHCALSTHTSQQSLEYEYQLLPPFLSLFLRVWLVPWLLLREMNQSNESNPRNKSQQPTSWPREAAERSRGQGTGLVVQTVSLALGQQHSHLTDKSPQTHRQAQAHVLFGIKTAAISHQAVTPTHCVICRGQRDPPCAEQAIATDQPSRGVALVELVGSCCYKSQMLTSPKESYLFYIRTNVCKYQEY